MTYVFVGPVGGDALRLLALVLFLFSGLSAADAQSLADYRSNKILIHDVQERLKGAGYDVGALDGSYGGKTAKGLAAFAESKGLGEAPIAEQLAALGIPLSAVDNIEFEIEPNRDQSLRIRNGLDNGIENLISQYNWKSFDVGRYAVSADGAESFTLDLTYCDRFDNGGNDCPSGRSRSQVRDDGANFSRHTVYTFEVNFGEAVEAAQRAYQYAEIYQAGLKYKHPETGEMSDTAGRYEFMIEQNKIRLIDNTYDDIRTRFGDRIVEVDQPVQFNTWHKVDLEVFWSNGEDGYFRYWFDGRALWQKTGRNTACKMSNTKSECRFQFKYGPYTSRGDGKAWEGVGDLIDHPIMIHYRGLRKITDASEVDVYVARLPKEFQATMKFGDKRL